MVSQLNSAKHKHLALRGVGEPYGQLNEVQIKHNNGIDSFVLCKHHKDFGRGWKFNSNNKSEDHRQMNVGLGNVHSIENGEAVPFPQICEVYF